MLADATNIFESPEKKPDSAFLTNMSGSRLKEKKDKRKKAICVDFTNIRKAIDFNTVDDKNNGWTAKLESCDATQKGNKSSEGRVLKFR